MTWARSLSAVAVALGVTTAPALAADIGDAPTVSPYITWGIALVLTACVVIAGFISSKRTHQD